MRQFLHTVTEHAYTLMFGAMLGGLSTAATLATIVRCSGA